MALFDYYSGEKHNKESMAHLGDSCSKELEHRIQLYTAELQKQYAHKLNNQPVDKKKLTQLRTDINQYMKEIEQAAACYQK